ncbi:MAG: ATP-binding protein [Planctomycetaceae bacterium]
MSGLFDCVEYSLSELALNVSQHSQSHGFVMAQFYEKRDLVCLAIADHGIGIKESFLRMGSQQVSEAMSDLDSIRKALEPRVSSKGHLATAWGDPINAGVGLTLLQALATEVGGKITIVSGAGAYSSGRGEVFPEECRFQGTICAMSFPRSRVTNFGQMLNDAKTRTGLLKSSDGFSELFQ